MLKFSLFVCFNNAGGCSYKANNMSSFNTGFAMILVKMSKKQALENLHSWKKFTTELLFMLPRKLTQKNSQSFQNV